MAKILINGDFFDEDKAFIHVKDRGFRFGDGIFDTIKVMNGKIYRFDLHLARIKGGLQALKVEFDSSIIKEQINKIISENSLQNGLARISITRGRGSHGYLPTNKTSPTFVIETMEERKMTWEEGKLFISGYKKPSLESLPVNFKIMQGLNSTLNVIKAREKGVFDGLMLNDGGYVCECSASNIFWVKGDKIFTPSLDCGVLDGVTRRVVIELLDNRVEQGKYTLDDLKSAEEVFVTNSAIGIFPIYEIEGIFENLKRAYPQTNKIKNLYEKAFN